MLQKLHYKYAMRSSNGVIKYISLIKFLLTIFLTFAVPKMIFASEQECRVLFEDSISVSGNSPNESFAKLAEGLRQANSKFDVVRGTPENLSHFWAMIDRVYEDVGQHNRYDYPWFLVAKDPNGAPSCIMGLIQTPHGVWIHKIGYTESGKKDLIRIFDSLLELKGWFLQSRRMALNVLYKRMAERGITPVPFEEVATINSSMVVPGDPNLFYTIRRPTKIEVAHAHDAGEIPNDSSLDPYIFVRQEHHQEKVIELPLKIMFGSPL